MLRFLYSPFFLSTSATVAGSMTDSLDSQKIYYLMIVNMPSDEELVQAATLMAQLEERKKQQNVQRT